MNNVPWRPIVEEIQDGTPVNAATTNVPIKQLAAQTRHLEEKVRQLDPTAGAMIWPAAPVDSTTIVGDFVYFDANSESCLKSQATAITGDAGEYTAGPQAFVIGMVGKKYNSTTADILLLGSFLFSTYSIDPTTMLEDPINDPFVPGRYYLSRKMPGKMTRHPASPTVLLGYFTESNSFIFPQQKDLFESHYHYHFPLTAAPSASQNYGQSGWHDFGNSIQRVDYFNRNTATAPPAFILCVRGNGNAPYSLEEPARLDIYKASDGNLGVNINTGSGLNFNNPQSAGATVTTLATVPWPAYGQWISIPGTNLDISFIRQDNTYVTTLAADVSVLPTYNSPSTVDSFKVFLPQDLTGWANANPLDALTPSNVLYRYVIEGQETLNAVWPPVPAEASYLVNNGTGCIAGVDFKITNQGIWWINGTYTGSINNSPWPFDWNAQTTASLDATLARFMEVNFTRSGLANADSVVMSLVGIPPIQVTKCPGGGKGSTGHLQIAIDLALTVNPAAAVDADTAFFSVSGVSFAYANLVSRLVQGNGVQLTRVDGDSQNPNFTGAVRIDFLAAKFEGEVDDIELRNAKPIVTPTHSAIAFLPPGTQATGITAMFKIPNRDYTVAQFALNVLGQFFGDTAVAGGANPQTAILRVAYHVIRPGFALSALNDGSSVVIQWWVLTFNAGYAALTMVSPEQPYDPTGNNAYQINAATLSANPGSLVATNGGFALGDQWVLQIDRYTQTPGGLVDTYPGRLGMTGLRWILS